MTKKALIQALEKFDDDDHLMFDEMAIKYAPKINKICGKTSEYTCYYCVLDPGHSGPCYCMCKNVEFEPDVE